MPAPCMGLKSGSFSEDLWQNQVHKRKKRTFKFTSSELITHSLSSIIATRGTFHNFLNPYPAHYVHVKLNLNLEPLRIPKNAKVLKAQGLTFFDSKQTPPRVPSPAPYMGLLTRSHWETWDYQRMAEMENQTGQRPNCFQPYLPQNY